MAKVKVLSAGDVEELMTLPMAIEAVESAYRQKARGKGETWPMVFHEFVHGVSDLDIKSGHMEDAGIFGLKLVSWYGENPGRGLPALYGTTLVFDLASGEPRALVNAGPVTDFRTGAAGAIGAKALARPDSRTLLMAGAGALAPYLIAATLYLMPGLEKVLLANPHHPEKAAEVLGAVTAQVDELLGRSGVKRGAEMAAAADLEAAVRESDIILTATPAYEPFIRAEWVRPGTHLSCVGADMSGKEEVDPALFATAAVFGDDEGQCMSVGECEIPHAKGLLSALRGELGAVLTGDLPGRTGAEEITIFDSTGIALQDLSSAAALLKAAEEKGLGVTAEL